MPVIPFLGEPLRSDIAIVRDYAERDIPEILIAYEEDPTLHVRLGRRRPPTGAELGRCTEHERGARAAGTRATFTILVPGSERCRGQLEVGRVEWGHKRADLALWVSPAFRGRGIGTAALAVAGPWLLRACALERLQILTDPANEPLVRAAQAAGFVPEGILRGYARGADGRVDAALLSLVTADLER